MDYAFIRKPEKEIADDSTLLPSGLDGRVGYQSLWLNLRSRNYSTTLDVERDRLGVSLREQDEVLFTTA